MISDYSHCMEEDHSIRKHMTITVEKDARLIN